MDEFEVLFYETERGEKPAMDFLESLDVKMQAKMIRTIELLQVNGNSLREPYSKPIGDGIFELRAQVASNVSRVLYFFAVGRRAVLTNGLSRKPPKRRRRRLQPQNVIEQIF